MECANRLLKECHRPGLSKAAFDRIGKSLQIDRAVGHHGNIDPAIGLPT